MAVEIVGLGGPVMDLVVNVPHMPEKDSFLRAYDMFHQGGGKVSTGMVACTRLGVSAGVLAKIGGDFTGAFILKDFKYNNVDTSRIIKADENTTGSYCISLSEEETGTRVFIGRNLRTSATPLSAEEVDFDYIKQAKYLLLENGWESSLAAAKFAKEHGIIVAVDGDSYSDELEAMLPWVDVFIGSEFYHKERFGDLNMRESCMMIKNMGPSVVWFTLGDKGCAGLVDDEFYEIPGFNVNVKDTTGAGDVFHGAYLVAMRDGMSHPECARFAGAVAAIKCTYVGGRTGIPTRAIVDRFLKDGVIETEELDERLQYYRESFHKGS